MCALTSPSVGLAFVDEEHAFYYGQQLLHQTKAGGIDESMHHLGFPSSAQAAGSALMTPNAPCGWQ
eukprot:CAMPEP_0185905808 /NCGR_PEP_ID=MMETSP0196C-20130402/4972_1 /TAXON_ID=2932 /ORGANISM="Alexandrium fundyense, Strain CCMP1719" /LENGTH=65 /DNA_ID=CAMNT_0028625407 /DNA_START=105 /DNA_END=302 /DNA_ORIENTATION=+